MKNRLPTALLALGTKLETEEGFAGFLEENRYRLADVCRKLARHRTPNDPLVRDASRQILGALHAAVLTSDNPPTDEEQHAAVRGCEGLAAEVGA